jgi:hypothetical protein
MRTFSTFRLLRVSLYLAALLSSANTCLALAAPVDTVLLSCPASAAVKVGSVMKVNCTVQNRGREPVYLLNEDPVLEGPRAPNVPYVYRCTGCGKYGRHENTLQYNKREVGTLDLPVLFHPTVHLRLKDLKRLVKVGAGTTRGVKLTWQLDPLQFPSVGEWLVQLKLIYLSTVDAGSLLQKRDLPPICRAVLAQALGGSAPRAGLAQGSLELVPFRGPDIFVGLDAKGKPIPNNPPSSSAPRKSKGVSYDGCHDVISEQFRDTYSNVWLLKISG